MSGITQVPGPPPTQSHLQHFTQTQGAVHIAVPLIQPQPQQPIWPDSPAQTYYVANPPTVIQSQPRQPTPTPRPRKPYTTTKVREMWTTQEHERMIQGLKLYKRDWAKVTSYVGTRSAAQVRSHAQKYFDRVARDKTDEYVPRARPKRKSSTPYPRKIRQQTSNSRAQPYHPPFSPSYPVPVVHPSTTSFEIQPVAFASPHLHHPVRIAPGQSPIFSQVSTSPYLAQPQQHAVNPQLAVPHRAYSPFVDVSSTPNSNSQGNVHPSTEIQASPVSYVSSQTYAAHSPAVPQQTISIPAPQMFGMLSPVTPGDFAFGSASPPSMTHTPVTVYGQPSMVRTNIPHITPRHSHPEGPIDNCAKCAALQRYGAVLQEIGELNYVQGHPDLQAQHGKGLHASSPMLNNAAASADLTTAASVRPDDQKEHVVDGTSYRQAPSSSDSGSLPPRKKTMDGLLPACSDDAIERSSHAIPAGNRAHRAKLMRARKMKRRNTMKERPTDPHNTYEDQSESTNSTLENQRRFLQGKDSTLPPQKPSSHTTGAVSRKRKMSSKTDNEMGEIEVRKKQRSSLQTEGRKRHSGHEDTRLDGECHSTDRQNRFTGQERSPSQESGTNNESVPSPKSDESETGPHSPLVETYSPKERMELFDAVHSLQILAKTSSSGSPSSRSKGDPRKSEEE